MNSFFINPKDCAGLEPWEKQQIIEGIFEAIEQDLLITIRGEYDIYEGNEYVRLSCINFMSAEEYYGADNNRGYIDAGGWGYVEPMNWFNPEDYWKK